MTTFALCISLLHCGPPPPTYTQSIERLAISQGWQSAEIPALMCVIEHESGFDPNAVNVNGGKWGEDYGLTQINSQWGTGFETESGEILPPFDETWTGEYLLQPANNLRAALEIWERNGFSAWHGYERC